MSTHEALSAASLVSRVQDVQLTAKNLSLEVGDVSFVYRRFGNQQTAAPALVMLQHFRGNLDNWDPALVDRLAQDREVILLDNRGVGGSTGVVPENVTTMAREALAFVDALGLQQIDLLGFSLGGYVAQELVLLRPRLVRRLVLAGTAPQGGADLHRWSDDVYALATPDEPTAEHLLSLSSPALSKVAPRAWSRWDACSNARSTETNRPISRRATPSSPRLRLGDSG